MGFELDGDDVDIESVISDAASFPTQEDLESIIVHVPESLNDIEVRSVSSNEYILGHNLSVRSGSSAPGSDRMAFYGGGSSIGGLSEKSTDAKAYKSDSERPSKVSNTCSTHFQNVSIAGIESISVRASSVKSDVATVCSGSAAEDIELASVGTAHSGHAFSVTSSLSMDKGSKRKHERGVEFANETSTRLFSDHPLNLVLQTTPSAILSSPLQSSCFMTLESSAVNDMGPPVRRFFLESGSNMESQTGSVRSVDCSPGTPPRAGSLRSFGSQAASEAVNMDDLGSDSHSTHGLDENHSQSSVKRDVSVDRDGFGVDASDNPLNNQETIQNVISLKERQFTTTNGRVSPGGTVYKGRGVRRYQGRYMNLPLTRFHQNQVNGNATGMNENIEGTIIHNGLSHSKTFVSADNTYVRWKRRSWSRSRSPTYHRPARSRSRSRDRNEERNCDSFRDKSRSPKSNDRQNFSSLDSNTYGQGTSRIHRNSNKGRSWRNSDANRYHIHRHSRGFGRRGR